MEDEEYQGVSFGRILKVAFGRWKLLLIITFAIGIVGFLGLYFGYNKLMNVYSATFSYSGSGLASEKMADNTVFNYKTLISKETLNEIKASKAEYASINVDQLVKDNAFSISRAVDKDSNEISYTVSIKRSKMPNADVTRNFFTDIANYPLQEDKNYIATSTFDSALKQFETAEKCEDQLSFLYAEGNTLIAGYNTMKGYNISSQLSDEIDASIREINTILDSRKMNTLSSMIVQYGLTTDYTNINVELLKREKLILDNDDPTNPGTKQKNEKLIKDITDQINAITAQTAIADLNGRVADLIVQNNNIDERLRQIDKEIANATKTPEQVEGNALFVSETIKIKDDLTAEIPNYKATMNKVYVDNATVTFANSNVLDVTKSMNLLMSILIPVAGGLVVALITNLIVDRKKLHDDEELVEETPAAK